MNVKDWKKKEAPVVARVREAGKALFAEMDPPQGPSNGAISKALADAMSQEAARMTRVATALELAAFALANGDTPGAALTERVEVPIDVRPVKTTPIAHIPEAFRGKITKRGKALASVYNYLVKSGPSRVIDIQKGSGTKTLGTTYQLLYRLAKDKLAEKVYIDKQLHYQAK